MIEETARVVAIEGEFAWVQTERRSTCNACSANGACGTSVLAKVLGQRRTQVRALNSIGAGLGDHVIVGLAEDALVRGSLAIYAVPLVGMIALALMGELFAPFGLRGDAPAVAGGAIGLALGLFWVRRFSRRVRADSRYQPVILRRLVPVVSGGDGVFAP